MSARIPVILAVDVEPDRRIIERDRRVPWHGYEALHAWLGATRPRIAEATGSAARFCWFFRMDPQVAEVYGAPAWAARHYDEAVRAAGAEGDEFGLHQHAFRWDGAASTWISDMADQAWVEHCVELGFEAFADHFGRPCRAFRFGDRWMNDATLRLLERLGARADLTLEPGMPAAPAMVAQELSTGALPDYADVPHRIYRPCRDDYRRPDASRGDGIRMVPVTTARVPAPGRGLRHAIRRISGARGGTRVVGLNLAVGTASFARVAARALARRDLTHLAVVVRSDAAIRPRYRANMAANIEVLLRRPERARFAFSTVQHVLGAVPAPAQDT